jgi:large subunit ribosomal protein L20
MSKLHKAKYFKLAKGYYGRAKNVWKSTKPRVEKALQHSYRGRKEKKRTNRQLWITNINAACLQFGVKYSQFMHGLALSGCQLNRKMLAELAQNEPLSMRSVIALSTEARKALAEATIPKKEVYIS